MIGAVLCLWQRAVDRLGDALEGPEMGNLRVTLAALSARVAAAEGEAARLRAELAGLRQTDHDVRTWCEQAADAMDAAYAAGFRYGVDHPGEAFRDACDLGVYLDDQRLRVEWNHGRQDEAAARRLGEDTRAMADAGVQGPSLTDPAMVIARLLDERDAAQRDLATAQSAIAINRESATRAGFLADAHAAEVERLTRERDAARGDRDETRRQIDRVAKDRDDLRAAARALRDLRVSSCHLCGRLATRQVGTKLEGDRATRCHLICDFCSPDRACSSQGALVEWVVDLNAASVIRPLLAEGAGDG